VLRLICEIKPIPVSETSRRREVNGGPTPFSVTIDSNGSARGRACLTSQHGLHACLDLDSEAWAFHASHTSVQSWMPLLVQRVPGWPRQVGLRGALELQGTYRDDTATLEVRGDDLAAVVDTGLSEPQMISFGKLGGDASWHFATRDGTATFNAVATGLGAFDAKLSLQEGRLLGEAQMTLDDLAPLTALEPAISEIRGTAKGSLSLSGTASEPRVDVAFSANGEVRVAPANIALRQVHFAMTGNSMQGVRIDGSAQSGEGEIVVTGTLGPGGSTHLLLSGHEFLLVDQPDLLAAVSPDVTIEYLPAAGLRVRGSLLVDRSGVVLTPALPDQLPLSDDVIIVGEDDDARRPSIDADLRIDLGPRTELVAGPLDTRLSGTLRLMTKPARPSQLIGSVQIAEGAYQLYGVPLQIESGRLDFTGPINNPAVQLRAIRQLDDSNQVGVEVTGTLSRLDTRLISNPPRPDTDALAMLITGRSFADASRSTGELDRIGNAAAALGLGATGIISRIREGMRLDELQISAPLDRQAGAIMVGKRLTDRLYARYEYSLFNRSGGLVLRYRVRPSLSLQTELGASRGVDVTYHREFD